MTEQEAREIASSRLEGSTITEVLDYGELFAIHFVNDEYYKSGDFRDMMVGAGPMFIEKGTRKVFETGSGQSTEMYVSAYNACGDLFARPSNHILVFGIVGSELKNNIIQLKQLYGCSMAHAKEIVTAVASNEKKVLEFPSPAAAEEACVRLADYGFSVRQLWSNDCQ